MDERAQPYVAPPGGFRTFLILWATQAFSVFGSQLTFFAMTVWLTTTLYPHPEQQPLLASALSAVALAHALPNVFMAPFAGVLADRVDRKTIMFWAGIAAGVITTILVWLLAVGKLVLWQLVLVFTCLSVAQSFHNSAFDASYVMIVPEKQLPRANGMMQTIFSLSGILSPVLAAALIGVPALLRSVPNPGWLVSLIAGLQEGSVLANGVNAATFFIAAAFLPFLSIPSPRRARTSQPRSLWGDVKEGMSFIGRRRGLLWLLLAFAVVNFCGAPANVLRPVIVRDNLAIDHLARGYSYEATLALLGSIGAIGGLAGGFIVATWGGLKRRRVLGVLIPLVVMGLAQTLFGLSQGVYLAAGATALTMFCAPLANAHSQTIWQTQTPRELQGRVFAVRRVVAQFTWPLGTAMAGLLGGLLSPGLTVALCGGIAALYALSQFANRAVAGIEEDVAAAPGLTSDKSVAAGPAETE